MFLTVIITQRLLADITIEFAINPTEDTIIGFSCELEHKSDNKFDISAELMEKKLPNLTQP